MCFLKSVLLFLHIIFWLNSMCYSDFPQTLPLNWNNIIRSNWDVNDRSFLDKLMFTVPRWQLQVYHTFLTCLFCSLCHRSRGGMFGWPTTPPLTESPPWGADTTGTQQRTTKREISFKGVTIFIEHYSKERQLNRLHSPPDILQPRSNVDQPPPCLSDGDFETPLTSGRADQRPH